MLLYLLRHGIPVEPEDWGESDRLRPLTDKGRAEVHAVIEALREELTGAEIWTSPYVRAEQTARIAGEVIDRASGASRTEVRIIPGLTSGQDLVRSLGGTQAWPEKLVLVGHMPDLGNLVSALTGSQPSSHGLGRAGIARLEGGFRVGGMSLKWLRTASEMIGSGRG